MLHILGIFLLRIYRLPLDPPLAVTGILMAGAEWREAASESDSGELGRSNRNHSHLWAQGTGANTPKTLLKFVRSLIN